MNNMSGERELAMSDGLPVGKLGGVKYIDGTEVRWSPETKNRRIHMTTNNRQTPAIFQTRDKDGTLWVARFAPSEIGWKDYTPVYEMG